MNEWVCGYICGLLRSSVVSGASQRLLLGQNGRGSPDGGIQQPEGIRHRHTCWRDGGWHHRNRRHQCKEAVWLDVRVAEQRADELAHGQDVYRDVGVGGFDDTSLHVRFVIRRRGWRKAEPRKGGALLRTRLMELRYCANSAYPAAACGLLSSGAKYNTTT